MVRLDSLLNRSDVPAIELANMTCDSREISTNDLFVAYKGQSHDGHDYIDDAIGRGAKCVIAEREFNAQKDIVSICDEKLVASRNKLASKFYGDPSSDLRCIGVTGTNGKTSVTYGLSSLLRRTACAGSLGWGKPQSIEPADMTTEDGVTIQRKLATLLDQGFSGVAMEVSSHGLDQDRVANVSLNVGVYTNLSRDHLDYHGSMAAYAAAKRKLFESFDLEYAVVNVDDWFGRELYLVCRMRGIPTTTFGLSDKADVRYELTGISRKGVCGTWQTPWGVIPLHLPVRSDFGVANCAAIASVLFNETGDFNTVAQCIACVAQPPGRLEFVDTPSDATVVLDFAHTPDALRRALSALRELTTARLICVFGCGGNRDRGKRHLMGAAVDQLSDIAIITNDNPRYEEPQSIAEDCLRGFFKPSEVQVLLDREEAIGHALKLASGDDIVLIAGKGDEKYQEIQGRMVPHSDREIILRLSQAS